MKIYFHFYPISGTNTYLITNEDTKEAVLIDPCKIIPILINQIEEKGLNLKAAFFTENIQNINYSGLKTLLKIYTPEIYTSGRNGTNRMPCSINLKPACGGSRLKSVTSVQTNSGIKTKILTGSGEITSAGFKIKYFTVNGKTYNSLMFKIENIIFTGACLSAGFMNLGIDIEGILNSKQDIKDKILNECEDVILMPLKGPPTSVKSEKFYNLDF